MEVIRNEAERGGGGGEEVGENSEGGKDIGDKKVVEDGYGGH